MESIWSPNHPTPPLASIWRPNRTTRFFLFSVRTFCKLFIDISCLGCKRSRVQISAARPNSSKSYRHQPSPVLGFGVQLESKRGRRAHAFRAHEKHCSYSWYLSHPRKTCHSRHFQPKLLSLFAKLDVGFSRETRHCPDISGQKPDIWPPARVRNAPGFSRSSRYSEFPVQPLLNPRPCGMKATVGEPATESTAPNANWRNMVEIIKKPKFLFVVQAV